MLLLLLLIPIAFTVDITYFNLNYTFICPVDKNYNFKFELYEFKLVICPLDKNDNFKFELYQKDFWRIGNIGNHLSRQTGTMSGLITVQGSIHGFQDGDEAFSDSYEIILDIEHDCSKDGSLLCERWKIGNCDHFEKSCTFVKNWTLIDEKPRGGGCGGDA